MDEKISMNGKQPFCKQMPIVPLSKWSEYFEFPSNGTMRNLCAHREDNGTDFWVFLHRKFYIDVAKFHAWLERKRMAREKR